MFSRSPLSIPRASHAEQCVLKLWSAVYALIKSRRCLGILNAAQMLEPDRNEINNNLGEVSKFFVNARVQYRASFDIMYYQLRR